MRRVLFITHRFPAPPDKGDRIRTYHLIRFLGARCRLDVAALADEPISGHARSLVEPFCDRMAAVPTSGRRWFAAAAKLARGGSASEGAFESVRLRRLIEAWCSASRYDSVLISCSGLAWVLDLRELRGVPAVADVMDVDSQKWADYAAASRGVRRQLYRVEAERLRLVERRLADRAAVTVVTDDEAELFSERTGRRATAITNGVDLDYFRPSDEPPSDLADCVFVGALDYRPNIDAAVWFAEQVWPGVRERHPSVRFRVVGRNPSPVVRRLGRIPGVEAVGAVADVRPYLRNAVAVAPLRIARGLQNKVLEAMAAGLPVVASPAAAAGLAVTAGVQLVEARSVDEWRLELCSLISSPGDRACLGHAARRFVEQSHDWVGCLGDFERLLDLTTCAGRKEVPACIGA